jgi:PTS system nitrogen regulatory IIA component
MNNNDQIIEIQSVLPCIRASNHVQVLQTIAREAGQENSINPAYLASRLLEQEKFESSGIGDGVALSHLTLNQIAHPYALFARLNEPVDFNAIDRNPVDLVFLLISPSKDGPLHLRRLFRMTKRLKDTQFVSQLRSTFDYDLLYAICNDSSQRLQAA